jgi:hypothetical protein
MATEQVTVDFECWSCSKQNHQTVSVETSGDTFGLNMKRRRRINVSCDNTNPLCGKTNTVEVDV